MRSLIQQCHDVACLLRAVSPSCPRRGSGCGLLRLPRFVLGGFYGIGLHDTPGLTAAAPAALSEFRAGGKESRIQAIAPWSRGPRGLLQTARNLQRECSEKKV